MSQRRAATRHPETGHEREPRRYALAKLQRLSKLAPEVLRANRVRSSLGPGFTTGTAGSVADRAFRDAGKKGLDPEDYEVGFRAIAGAAVSKITIQAH
jgi:hypothetical protein